MKNILAVILIILGIASIMVGSYFIVHGLNESTLYSKEIDNVLKENNIYDEVIEKEYSKTLETAIKENKYKKEYLINYTEITYKEENDFIDNINILLDLKYSVNEINLVFDTIKYESIDIFTNKKIDDIEKYISDKYFDIDKLSRYLSYSEAKDYEIDRIIMYVNIGLDNEFYTNIKEIDKAVDKLTLVNKYNKLTSNYSAPNLVTLSSDYAFRSEKLNEETAENFKLMVDSAKKAGYNFKAVSGYRTESLQNTLYTNSVNSDGKDYADRFSARKGHSEHQTGYAVDISENGILNGFENTTSYSWMKENAYKYGFIERYSKENEFITGYGYEPWHYRYVGVEVATIIYNEKITFEEYHVKYLSYSS